MYTVLCSVYCAVCTLYYMYCTVSAFCACCPLEVGERQFTCCSTSVGLQATGDHELRLGGGRGEGGWFKGYVCIHSTDTRIYLYTCMCALRPRDVQNGTVRYSTVLHQPRRATSPTETGMRGGVLDSLDSYTGQGREADRPVRFEFGLWLYTVRSMYCTLYGTVLYRHGIHHQSAFAPSASLPCFTFTKRKIAGMM